MRMNTTTSTTRIVRSGASSAQPVRRLRFASDGARPPCVNCREAERRWPAGAKRSKRLAMPPTDCSARLDRALDHRRTQGQRRPRNRQQDLPDGIGVLCEDDKSKRRPGRCQAGTRIRRIPRHARDGAAGGGLLRGSGDPCALQLERLKHLCGDEEVEGVEIIATVEGALTCLAAQDIEGQVFEPKKALTAVEVLRCRSCCCVYQGSTASRPSRAAAGFVFASPRRPVPPGLPTRRRSRRQPCLVLAEAPQRQSS